MFELIICPKKYCQAEKQWESMKAKQYGGDKINSFYTIFYQQQTYLQKQCETVCIYNICNITKESLFILAKIRCILISC